MNYYLKYLKYKKKYLDLKNLDLNGGLGLNNYKDLEGGVLGLRDITANMIPHYQFDANIEQLANYWQNTIGPVSYQIGYDRENNHHLGYFFMFNYNTPDYDDRHNHIHIFSSFENENYVGFNYSLKVNNRHMFLNGNEINAIIINTNDFNDIGWQTIVRDRLQGNIYTNPDFYIRYGLANNNTIRVDKYVGDNYKTGDIIAYECGIMFSQIAKIALILQYITTIQTLPTT